MRRLMEQSGETVNLAILDSLKVQKTKSYEVGAKANLFHQKLALGLAVFQTDITNARVQIDANTVGFFGKTRIRGVELTANGTILPGWTVFGGYTYLDAKIIEAGFTALTAPAVPGQAAQVVYVPSVNSGKQVPQTAKNSFTLSTNYQATRRFSFGGGAYYMDRQIGGYLMPAGQAQSFNPVFIVLLAPLFSLSPFSTVTGLKDER